MNLLYALLRVGNVDVLASRQPYEQLRPIGATGTQPSSAASIAIQFGLVRKVALKRSRRWAFVIHCPRRLVRSAMPSSKSLAACSIVCHYAPVRTKPHLAPYRIVLLVLLVSQRWLISDLIAILATWKLAFPT